MSLFKKKPPITPTPTPTPGPLPSPSPVPLTIPHPEETMNPVAKATDVNVPEVIQQWLSVWNVPQQYWDYWKTAIDIRVVDGWSLDELATGLQITTPAYSMEVNGRRQLHSLAAWFNKGVTAHENCHNTYALLTDDQKAAFTSAYTQLKTTGIIAYLYSINSYGLTNDIEGHAEVYRYLGDQMPEVLKQFYHRLF